MPTPALDTGNTAWILTSTALVLFMTMPGLALFYGGLVRAKNVLSVLMQCFAITALVTLLWLAFGYSVAFEPSGYEKSAVGLHSFVGGPLEGVPRRTSAATRCGGASPSRCSSPTSSPSRSSRLR